MRSKMLWALVLSCVTACVGDLDDGTTAGPPGPYGGPPPTTTTPVTPTFQPSGVRRLGRLEYDNAVGDLLGTTGHPSAGFAGDARVAGYTTSADLRVDAVLGDQFRVAAESLATEALTSHHATVVPCTPSDAACPRTFVEAIATRAFRRPATPDEIDGLLRVFHAGADGGTFDEGANAVVRAVLQAASFLYVAQIGVGSGQRALDGYEVASALSFLLTAAPPDAALLAAARADALRTADQREAQARRILADDPRARAQMTRFVREWLGTDTLDDFARTASSGDFVALRPLMEEETQRFVEAVVFDGDGTFESLMSADFTFANGTLARFYGISGGDAGWARRDLSGTARRGILSQGAFLAAHARTDASSPVKRGATLLSRVFCRPIPLPTGQAAVRAMMEPPSGRTTRERFAQHSSDPTCSGCHSRIDPLGFGFEHFDQIGAYRDQENGVAVDGSGALVGTDVDGPFADTAEMVGRIAHSGQAQACLARNVYRFASGAIAPGPEASFLATWTAMPPARRTSLIEMFVELARSDVFAQRTETP